MTQDPEQVLLLNHLESPLNFDLRRNCVANPQDNLENVKDFSNVCRTCAAVTEFIVPIFEGEGLQNNLADKIHQHLPIKVSEQDSLPRVVCYQCTSTLLAWHELVKCCLQADEALKTKQAVWAAEASVQEKPGPSDEVTVKDIDDRRDDPTSQDESIQECKTMKEIMRVVQFCFSNHRDVNGLTFACQLCEWNVLYGPALLTDHLLKKHPADTTARGSVIKFIENNVSIIELLDSEGEDQPEIVKHTVQETIQSEIVEEEYEELGVNGVRPTHSVTKSTENRKKANAGKVRVTEYPCPFCDSVFTSPTRLACHAGRHRQVTINDHHVCNVCELEFDTKKGFVAHLTSRHRAARASRGPELASKCRGCGFVAQSLRLLRLHVKEKHEPTEPKKSRRKSAKTSPVQCEHCEKSFSDKYNLAAHVSRQHAAGAGRRWACARCPRSYRAAQSLRDHERAAHDGELRFVCGACGERFPRRAALAVHELRHSGAAPHACALCGKAFRARDSLRRHLDAHAGRRDHRCARCPKSFRNSSHLKRHVAALHDRLSDATPKTNQSVKPKARPQAPGET